MLHALEALFIKCPFGTYFADIIVDLLEAYRGTAYC
jgi:hypothetical protein